MVAVQVTGWLIRTALLGDGEQETDMGERIVVELLHATVVVCVPDVTVTLAVLTHDVT